MTDYGIVLMSHFARENETSVLKAKELAVRASLPLPTVSKILKSLSRGDLLVSERGANGGYRLARLASDITVAEIIQTLDGPIAVTDCSDHTPGLCGLESRCPVRNHWRIINQAVLKALEDLRLSDMISPLGIEESAELLRRENAR